MNKTYLIFKHEFLHKIKGAGFITLTLILPVAALAGIGIFKLVATITTSEVESTAIIGYVDEVGLFDNLNDQGIIKLAPYESRQAANHALERQDISEYFIIPPDYTSSGIIQRFTLEKEANTPPTTVWAIKSFLTGNLLKDKVSPDIVAVIISPLNLQVTHVTPEGDIPLEQSNLANIIVPGVFAMLLSFALMFGTISLITGLGEEKESRLIEVLFSSISARQLLVGKVLALGLAGLLQVLVWLISIPLLLNLASSTFGGLMSQIQIPANFLFMGTVYFILGYMLFAVISIGIGAVSSNAQEGAQLSMFFTLATFIPLWFVGLLANFPHHPIWVGLTIFPITAPIQTMLRLGVSDIPIWQIVTSIGVLVLSIILGLYLSIKIFRVYMLMYGKRPGIAEIMRNLKNA
jgi:ABC-2 type transport system permease protein